MGRKQKMKKAAAAAAAAATAASAAVGQQQQQAAVAEENNNSNNVTNMQEVEEMMKLFNDYKAMPSTSGKGQASSGSGSALESDNSDSDDAVTVVSQSLKSEEKKSAADIEFVPIQKQSRGEKKARRLLMKLDLEKVPNVSRVTMRKAKNMLLCVDQPEVYKCPHTNTYICFGEVRVEDTSNAATAQAAERYLNDANVGGSSPTKNNNQLDDDKNDNDDADYDEDALDDGQLSEKDIELVQMQAGCSRPRAIKALIKHQSDVVNAIMDLTVA